MKKIKPRMTPKCKCSNIWYYGTSELLPRYKHHSWCGWVRYWCHAGDKGRLLPRSCPHPIKELCIWPMTIQEPLEEINGNDKFKANKRELQHV